MQDKSINMISIILLSISMLALYLILIYGYEQLETTQDHTKEIFNIHGNIKKINTYQRYTRMDIQYLTTQQFIVFDNISLQKDSCVSATVQKENEQMIIKKIRACQP